MATSGNNSGLQKKDAIYFPTFKRGCNMISKYCIYTSLTAKNTQKNSLCTEKNYVEKVILSKSTLSKPFLFLVFHTHTHTHSFPTSLIFLLTASCFQCSTRPQRPRPRKPLHASNAFLSRVKIILSFSEPLFYHYYAQFSGYQRVPRSNARNVLLVIFTAHLFFGCLIMSMYYRYAQIWMPSR